jgi:hypothetical protein
LVVIKSISFPQKQPVLYSLPDGREFVAHAAGEAGYSLYTLRAWKTYGMAEYRVHPDGKILSKGIPTRWSAAGLKDTGRSVKYLSSENQGRTLPS